MAATTGPGTARTWDLTDLLGGLALDEVIGLAVDPSSVVVTADRYEFGSPATGALLRVRGRAAGGEPWSAFVKVLQHVRHWPMLAHMPPEAARQFLDMFPWREELGLWRPALVDRLPAGLRVPRLHRVVELGDDRVAVWSEEVDVDDAPWDEARFARAAYLLGVLNARMCDPDVLAEAEFPPDLALQKWVSFGLQVQGAAPLSDDALWAHPMLRAHADLRADLRAALPMVDRVLALFAGLRHGMPHGDASPQNLLVPRDGSADFVVIDPNFQTPAPLGSDLGQLVVGLAHAGVLPPERLPAVEDAVLPAYRAGVGEVDLPPGRDDLAAGYAGSLLLRSGFTAVPYDAVGDPARAGTVTARLGLARFALGAAARHLRDRN